ncbi:Endonuclease-reverse transcriptase [Operophtera brumata]|uniref:Endonuclease-reverse transcriptase n=1 Tax=Operophtera brumata TaxID=104452 RepID=A0A0L7L607_OPEBR|nr:Endonuclease-reverse transcriptase [Operophtera brumata]
MEGIMEILKIIQNDLSSHKQEMRNMEQNITQSINSNINEKFTQLEAKTAELESKIIKQQETIDILEKQVRKKNIVLFGIEETEHSYSGLVTLVIDIVAKNMNIDCHRGEIEEVRRLGRKSDKIRPVIVTFTNVGRKIDIIRNKKSLEGSHVYAKEDYPPKVLEKRKQLQEELNREREAGKKVVLRYDKIVELKTYDVELGNTRKQKRPLPLSPEMSSNADEGPSRIVKQVPKKNKSASIASYLCNNTPANTSKIYNQKNF